MGVDSQGQAFPRSTERGLIEAIAPGWFAFLKIGLPRSTERGLIEAVTLLLSIGVSLPFRVQLSAGLIEAEKTAGMLGGPCLLSAFN